MSKGGSTTSEVKVPEYIEAAAQRNLNRADRVSQLGYVPDYGPTVAAFTPMQQAAFQNTAGTADAFGMSTPTSQRDIMGGMDAPTTYANGVRGYSSAPMYEEMVSELARNRPGQKSYIDSFFIDPASGNYQAQAPVDYTHYNTMAEDARVAAEGARDEASANRAHELAVARAGAPSYNTSTTTLNTPLSYLPGGVNDPFLTSAPSEAIADMTGIPGMTRDDNNVYTRPSGAPETSVRPVARPSDTGGTVGYTGIADMFDGGGPGTSGDTFGGALGGVSNAVGATPTGSSSSESKDTGGSVGYTSFADMFDGGGPGTSGDTFGGALGGVSNAVGAAPTGSSKSESKSASKSASESVNDSMRCVVATHAVENGAFSPRTKREAVVWCMNVLHGKWWGEAIRRGYRYCGTKKIEQGKAREHYDEFRRYIAFASGKKRDVRGAITFALRTAQFFAVGLIKRDA